MNGCPTGTTEAMTTMCEKDNHTGRLEYIINGIHMVIYFIVIVNVLSMNKQFGKLDIKNHSKN